MAKRGTNGVLRLGDVAFDNVKVTRDTIASGTFLKVYKAYHKRTVYAAKEFMYSDTTVSRDSGFDTKGNPRNHNTTRLLQECQRCMQLNHRNVVRLLGLCYSAPAVPILIVEKLRETLNFFLGKNADIDYACKLSILLDVAQGLMYLHSRDTPIVHGRLTSQCVLLTDLRRAKITGDSAVTSLLKEASLRRSKIGSDQDVTVHFFPFGVQHGDPADLPLDVFSYGGIVIHVLTQMWPKPSSYSGSRPISETDRRLKYINAVDDHRFKKVIHSCMDDDSKVRPDIVKVHAMLQNIANEETSPTRDSSTELSAGEVRQDNVTNHKEDKAEQIHKQKDKIIQQKDEKIAKLEQECQQKDETIQRNDEEIREKNKIIKKKDLEIEHVHKQYYEVENQLKELKLQKENGRAKSELNHAETPNNLHNTGAQMTGNELNKEVDEKFQQEGKEKLNNNQHISGKGEQINIVIAKDASNNRDVKGENGEYRIKPVRPADKQLEHKVKRIAVALCSVENLTHHVIANVPASALVTLKNHQGKPMNNCGDTISVKIQPSKYGHATTLPFSITERGNGQYDVSYTISEASDYRLHILVNDQNIVNPPHRICCLQYPHQASENGSQMRIIKPLQNTTSTSCYFNSVLQVLNQTNGFIEMMLKYGKNRERNYLLPYQNDNDGVNIEMPINLHGVIQDSLLYAIIFFLKSVECDTDRVIKPDYVLHRLTENSKQQRFGQHTQEDSHELLRYLLYELKKEEIDLIKDGVYEYFGINSEYSSNPDVDNQTKLIIKSLLRTATKVTTPIDEVFGGVKLNTVICRECQTPSQTLEPFFDLSLGIPDTMKYAAYSSSFGRGYAKGNSNIQQQPPVGRSGHYGHTAHSHHHTDNTTIGHPYPTRNQNYWGQHGRSNTFSGEQQGGAEVPMYDDKSVRDLLKSKKMFYQPTSDERTSDIDVVDDVQSSLADHTDIDNMDEENKFICKKCSADKGTATDASGDKIHLCLVTKQILIHQLPQALIIHFKRFNIGAFSVTKESKHVTFLPILNMAPYCSNKCLEKFGDAKGEILYGLYGVVEHMGLTLQSGHYIAYVRRRPERQQKFASRPANNKTWIYDGNAAHDGKWFYTSDLTVRECLLGFEIVKGCKAYMLFYELLPWINYGNDR